MVRRCLAGFASEVVYCLGCSSRIMLNVKFLHFLNKKHEFLFIIKLKKVPFKNKYKIYFTVIITWKKKLYYVNSNIKFVQKLKYYISLHLQGCNRYAINISGNIKLPWFPSTWLGSLCNVIFPPILIASILHPCNEEINS